MSRNFELLKQLESSEWRIPALDDRIEPISATAINLRQRIQGRVYDELCQFVHRLFPMGGHGPTCVLFTGAAPSVGCTWVAVHTAKVLCSRTPARACLVCIDVSHDHLRQHFDSSAGETFEQLDVHNPSPRKVASNLWVLTTDKDRCDLAAPSPTAENLLIELRRRFDYVLLDAPPVTRNSLACSFASFADGAVLVLKAGHTRRPAVQLAIERLESTGVKVLGAVLNQRDYPIPHSIYHRL
jgi:hypothetical protein